MVWPCKQNASEKASQSTCGTTTNYAERTTLRILDGTGWGFTLAKSWRWWRTVMCDSSILTDILRTRGGRGSIFRDFLRTSLMDGPQHYFLSCRFSG